MTVVARFLSSFLESDAGLKPGEMFLKLDGTIWVVLPNGTQTQVGTGGGGGTGNARVVGPFQINGNDSLLSHNVFPNAVVVPAVGVGDVILDAWGEIEEVFDHGLNGIRLVVVSENVSRIDIGALTVLAPQADGEVSSGQVFQGFDDQTSTLYPDLNGNQNVTISQGVASLSINGAINRFLPVRITAPAEIQAYIVQAKAEPLPSAGVLQVYFLVATPDSTW